MPMTAMRSLRVQYDPQAFAAAVTERALHCAHRKASVGNLGTQVKSASTPAITHGRA